MIHVLIYIFSSVDFGECFFVIDIDEAATPAVCWIKHLIRWCSFFRLGLAASTSPYTVSGCYSSSSNVFYWLNPWVEMSHNIRICLFPIKGIVFRVSALLCSEHNVFFLWFIECLISVWCVSQLVLLQFLFGTGVVQNHLDGFRSFESFCLTTILKYHQFSPLLTTWRLCS